MELSRFNEIMGIKEMIMEKKKKEIIIKAVKVEDTKFGPRIGICDAEGTWINSRKSQWDKIPGAWERLTSLKAGDRVDVDYEIRPYVAKDGSNKTTNEILGFDVVIRPQDEVKSVTAPSTAPQALPRETPTPKSIVPEIGARQTALNVAVQVVGSWVEKSDLTCVESVIAVAKQIYASLKEAW
jgi:hypothetical protein